MSRRRRKLAVVCLGLGVAAIVSIGLATAADQHLTAAPPAFTAKQLGAPPANDWISTGGNVQNERYSTLKDVNLSNVDKLQVAWHIHLGETQRQQQEASGIIYQGTYYIVSGNGDAFAFNAATGEQIWKYTAPSVGGVLQRGFALGGGKLFYGEVDNYMVAIDATTGKLAWKSDQLADPKAGYALNGAATYYNGMVYEGVSGSENGIRGFLAAWNANTGKLMW
jgi:quinohemoprotein ethanol dehydrogenase